jgi:DNA-binding MarR family transcriptional regulator
MVAATSCSTACEAVRSLARLARVLERRCGDELSLAHYRVLAAVAGGDERASRVAARLALGKPAVSAAVEALVGKGLVERSEVAADQRAMRLGLTALGRAVLERAEGAMTEALQTLAASTDDPEGTLRSLASLGAALDAHLAAGDRSR